MFDYTGKVVAITGAASGIGKELTFQFAAKGARLSLADIDAEKLAAVKKELKSKGTKVITAVFDISNYEDMKAFARNTFEAYGMVDLFFNNAGVASVGTIWEQPLQDWNWILGVNVMGLVHGIKAFVPTMIKLDKECRIINTGSTAGLITPPNSAAYVASKHAAVSLTEVMELQLQGVGAKVKAHVICPAYVKTDLNQCSRHMLQQEYDSEDSYYQTESYKKELAKMNRFVLGGMPVETAVERIISGIEQDKFYILTHPEINPDIVARANRIVEGSRPVRGKK